MQIRHSMKKNGAENQKSISDYEIFSNTNMIFFKYFILSHNKFGPVSEFFCTSLKIKM